MGDTVVRSWAWGSDPLMCRKTLPSFKHFIYSGSVIFVAPKAFFLVHFHSLKQLVIAGRAGVVEVAVGVHLAESSQTDPAEVLLTGRTGHLVTAVHLLYISATARALFTVILQPVCAERLLHRLLNDTPTKTLLKELLPLFTHRHILIPQITKLISSHYAVREAVIAPLTERTEGVSAGGTDAHGGVRLHHHSHTAAHTRTIHHIRHQVQTRLQQETIIACKLIFAHEKFHL